jgi:hypothetical protein
MREEAMKRSTDRILTTHAGSLPMLSDLSAMLRAVVYLFVADKHLGLLASRLIDDTQIKALNRRYSKRLDACPQRVDAG